MRRYILPVLVLMSGFLVNAKTHAAPTANYVCETTDSGIKIYFDFKVEFEDQGHRIKDISAAYGTRYASLFPRQVDEPAIEAPQPGHIRMMADSQYGFWPLRLTVEMGASTRPEAEIARDKVKAKGVDGPEVPWPLLDGWVKVDSMFSSHSRPMTCELEAFFR